MKEKKFHGYSGNSPRLTNSILECQTTWKFAFSEKQKSTSSIQKHKIFLSSKIDELFRNCEWRPENLYLTLDFIKFIKRLNLLLHCAFLKEESW